MDPEEYILHSHPASSGVYGPPTERRHQPAWAAQLPIPQPPRYSWMGLNTSLSAASAAAAATASSGASSPQSPSHRRPGNSSFQLGHPASPLPLADPAFSNTPQQDAFAPPPFWSSSLQQTSGPHTVALPSIVHPPASAPAPTPSRSHDTSLSSPNSRNPRVFSTFQPPMDAAAHLFPPGTLFSCFRLGFMRTLAGFPSSLKQAPGRQRSDAA
jgi:hypothetical protein